MEKPVMEDEGIYGEFFSNRTTWKSTRTSEHLTLWEIDTRKSQELSTCEIICWNLNKNFLEWFRWHWIVRQLAMKIVWLFHLFLLLVFLAVTVSVFLQFTSFRSFKANFRIWLKCCLSRVWKQFRKINWIDWEAIIPDRITTVDVFCILKVFPVIWVNIYEKVKFSTNL
jgi:hypothetical protein